MPKKKELPRKRKRFLRKVFFLCLISFLVLIVVSGTGYYYFVIKHEKPQTILLLPTKNITQAKQEDTHLADLKQALAKENITYSSVTKDKDGALKVVLEKGGEVTFSSQKDIMTQIASLQYILSHLTMEGKLFSQLDLRFEKPVIKLRE